MRPSPWMLARKRNVEQIVRATSAIALSTPLNRLAQTHGAPNHR
jgi:hypothetical protein